MVPHFELVFFPTLEAVGKMHPWNRILDQWDQMASSEKTAQINDIAETYVAYGRKYNHSALVITEAREMPFDAYIKIVERIREISGNEFFLLKSSDPTMPIPSGENMVEISAMMYEEPERLIEKTKKLQNVILSQAEKLQGKGLIDGYVMCSDYCFNTNPFFSRDMFAELICPSLSETIKGFHDMGFYAIKHTDGNIMPIVDMMIECGPDALHSLDPQGGVSLKELKAKYKDRVAFCGNVNCGLLQTGTEEEVIEDVKRSLREGMNGYGYIFCTSNCIYTGLDLSRYELMHKLWEQYGVYPTLHE